MSKSGSSSDTLENIEKNEELGLVEPEDNFLFTGNNLIKNKPSTKQKQGITINAIHTKSINYSEDKKMLQQSEERHLQMRKEQVDEYLSKKRGLIDNNISDEEVKSSSSHSYSRPQIFSGGDFADVVTKGTTFVDKSLFIEELFKSSDKVTLITMPRRWGKSLNLDMLKRFLSIQVDKDGNAIDKTQTDNYKFFAGGKIKVQEGFITKEKEVLKSKLVNNSPEALEVQGTYPVIYIDFKDCKGTSVDDIRSKLNKKIIETVTKFYYLAHSSKLYEETTIGQRYNELLNKTKSGDFEETIKDLSSLLHSYHGQKVWILIDEYDAAANKAYLKFSPEDAEQVSDLFRSIFEPALKNNDALEKGVITGVQYIVKSGMLSGLNNLSKHNITSTVYSKYYGIDQSEMNDLLQHFKIDESKAIRIKDWYNGYKSNIGTAEDPVFNDKYNVWSVVNYLNKQSEGFKSYWEKSGSVSDFLDQLFKNKHFKQKIEDLVNGLTISSGEQKDDFSTEDFKQLKAIKEGIDILKIKDDGLNLVFSYLFITGYLTLNENQKLQFPNKEIIKEMSNYLKSYYSQIFNISTDSLSELTSILEQIFLKKDNNEMSELFKSNFAPKFTAIIKNLKIYNNDDGLDVKGVFGNEDLVHSLLNNIAIQVVNAKFATERYTTKKTDMGKGRADIVLSKLGKGIVIEMKYNENGGDHKKQAKDALDQAKEYTNLVKNDNLKICVGCNITSDQEVYLAGEILEGEVSVMSFEYP